MISKILAPEDLKVGAYVTILKWERNDRSWVGNALEVKAICLPFIVADGRYNKAIELDTREVSLMAISKEYFDASHRDETDQSPAQKTQEKKK